jgi:hypothetical protein
MTEFQRDEKRVQNEDPEFINNNDIFFLSKNCLIIKKIHQTLKRINYEKNSGIVIFPHFLFPIMKNVNPQESSK